MGSSEVDQLTPAAQRTGIQYAHVLDLVKACTTAVENGSWADLADAAGALSTAADELADAAAALTREPVATSPRDVLTTRGGSAPNPV